MKLKWVVYVAFGAWLAAVSSTQAAEVQGVNVSHVGERYTLDLRMRLAVPADAAWAIFKRFDDLPRLNPIFTYAKATPEADPDHVLLKTVVHGCVLVFCRDVTQVQDVHLYPQRRGGYMETRVVPAQSDFSYGKYQWIFLPCPTRRSDTCLRLVAVVQPKFWIPPWIGGWLVERQMRDQAEVVARSVEREARQEPALPASAATSGAA
ncbi:MAG TPA: SRPBCC family protein [Nevskiaceae bacterium]|nr:SRPBCC family protein [Nevskiaceae bacterium]